MGRANGQVTMSRFKSSDFTISGAGAPFPYEDMLSAIPLMAAHNGPSYLLHTVETLHALRVPLANVRLLPVIGRWCGTEVEPYYHDNAWARAARPDMRKMRVRLGVSVREDNRLRRFYPLVAVGMPSQEAVRAWRERGETAASGFRELCARLGDIDPEWTNNEPPAERLCRLLCRQFPELRDSLERLEGAGRDMLPASSIREGRWDDRQAIAPGQRGARRVAGEAGQRAAQALVDLFLTRSLLAVATADMMGGFAYELPIEPKGRAIDVEISDNSDARGVAKWLQTYPHHPLPTARYIPPEAREQQEWDEYFRLCPDHDNIFETAPKLWTEEDPAIIALFGDIRAQVNAGHEAKFTSEEMLTLARKRLPDYLPHYPRQFAVTGGMNLEGILLTLLETWMAQEPTRRFLGLSVEDWRLFAPDEQLILGELLLQRRQTLDQTALFQTVARLLVDSGIATVVESFRLEPVRLGQSLAQLGVTLSLNGVCALHAPEMVVTIPLDRDRDPRSPDVEQKLKIIARLFLPAHIPMRTVWKIDRPLLGVCTYLRRAGATTGPATRLG